MSKSFFYHHCLKSVVMLGVGLFLAASVANAVTVQEGASDFSNRFDDQLFDLQIGENTISGRVPNFSDFDGFSVHVPDGSILRRITLSVTNVTPELRDTVRSLWAFDGSGDFRIAIQTFLADETADAFTTALPLDAGIYRLAHRENVLIRDGDASSVDYTWSYKFEVAAVPIPAGGWLLLSGLGALALVRRYSKGTDKK